MKDKKKWLVLCVALGLLAGGGGFLYRTGFFQAAASLEGLRTYITRFTPYSHLIFFLLQFLSVVLAPIPSNITAAAGGVLFGTWPAFLLTFGAVVSGSLLVFWYWAGTLQTGWSAGSCPSGIKRSCGLRPPFF